MNHGLVAITVAKAIRLLPQTDGLCYLPIAMEQAVIRETMYEVLVTPGCE